MTLYHELVEIMNSLDEPIPAFEALGITDHDSLRRYTYRYVDEVAEGLREEGRRLVPEDLGAAMIGGFYLGLAYAHRKGLTAGGSPAPVI